MAKKHKHEEHENHERWLVSWADFMTLLFAFFVVMYATSRTDTKKLKQASESLRWALHFQGTGGVDKLPVFEGPPSEGGCVTSPGNAKPDMGALARQAEKVRQKLEQRLQLLLLERGVAARSVSVTSEPGRVSVRLAAAHFFDPQQAVLRPEVLPVLDAIAQELAGLRRPVRVEGHTDDQPTRAGRFRDNWELSASRAASVASYLEGAHQIPAPDLSAVGFGHTRPVMPNDTEEGRETNRRIELSVELRSEQGNLPVR